MSCRNLLADGLKAQLRRLRDAVFLKSTKTHHVQEHRQSARFKVHRHQIGHPQDVRKALDPLSSLSALLGEAGTPGEQ